MKKFPVQLVHQDARGQLLAIDRGNLWVESNLIVTRAGVTRGSHYHKETLELIFFVQGQAKAKVINLKLQVHWEEDLTTGIAILIEPFGLHYIETHRDSVWLNMLSHRFDQISPDVHLPTEEERRMVQALFGL